VHRAFQTRKQAGVGTLRHVEAHVTAEPPGRAERIAGGQHDPFGDGGAGHVGRIHARGQPAPQEHARIRFDPGIETDALQPFADPAHGLGKATAQSADMFAIGPVLQQGQNQVGGKRAAAKGGREFEIDDFLDPVGARRNEAAAHGGRQGFGKAADMDDAVQTVERRQARRRLALEIGEYIVFDDDEVVVLGEFQDTVGNGRRQGCSGRVVQSRIGDVEAGRMVG